MVLFDLPARWNLFFNSSSYERFLSRGEPLLFWSSITRKRSATYHHITNFSKVLFFDKIKSSWKIHFQKMINKKRKIHNANIEALKRDLQQVKVKQLLKNCIINTFLNGFGKNCIHIYLLKYSNMQIALRI